MSAVPNLPADIHSHGLSNGTNGVSIPQSSGFVLRDTPVENLRPMKVIVIGAGYSGIYCGIRIPERLRNVELVIYEKNKGIGGTWWENRYLGCACDVPSHSYQYSFEPNPNWSSLYAPSREIQAYLEGVAKKYSADRFIKLSHEITECRWNDLTAKWHITVRNLVTGDIIQDTSDVLISARGNLNNPAWPSIQGLDTFKGELMHSARWNESYDFSNKRVGVIGTGSSSIQIVPCLQRIPGTQVTTFARSKTWISPSFSQHLWDKHGFEGFSIPQEVRDRFLSDPAHYEAFRLAVEADTNSMHPFSIKGSDLQLGAKGAFTEHMRSRLETHPHIFDALLPSFSPGCRRLTPGPGYLEALTQPNVSFITSPISRISESSVHTEDGTCHELDALVCATGFHASRPPPFPVLGTHGLPLTKKWEHRATTYLSHSIASFPNMFCMLGPNSATGAGSLTTMIEAVGDYVVRCVRKMQKENIAAMEVRAEREEDFAEYVDAYFKGTVFGEECSSWYKDAWGRVAGLWPGSTLHCREAMRSPRWEDYVYRYVGEEAEEAEEMGRADPVVRGGGGGVGGTDKKKRANRLAWLGNGWTVNQVEGRDLAWYLYPQFLEKPVAPRPEENGEYKIHPFSH